MTRTVYLIPRRLSLTIGYHPQWPRPLYRLHDNGGRLPHETLDVGVLVWRLALSATLWGIGGWSVMVVRVLGAKEYPHVE